MSSTHDVKDDSPDRIGPDTTPKSSFGDKLRLGVRKFTTKDGLIGNYDYAFLFKPNLPFIKKERRAAPFFGLHQSMPVLLALLLGFQHSLAMLAGIITPPIILSSAANLTGEMQAYLVSTSLIVSAILSIVQITRLHIYRTPYYLGTGLISVVGTSFATIPVATGALGQMYANGYCPSDANGDALPCPKGYGAILGTQCICALLEILMSFTPPKLLKRIFPPLVTGPTVLLIGVKLIGTGFANWAGGSNDCKGRPETGLFALCPNINAPRPLPWGSAEFIGLGFLVFVTIILCERFGSPIMKSTAVVVGLLVGCIVAAACGYFDRSGIDAAPVASFIWVHTFPLSLYGPLVLPLLAVYIVLAMEWVSTLLNVFEAWKDANCVIVCQFARLYRPSALSMTEIMESNPPEPTHSHPIQPTILTFHSQHRRRYRHLRRLAPPSRRPPLRLPYPRRRAGRRHRRLHRRPLHHHAHVRLRAEQRRDRAHALRQPQGRLRRLLLAAGHGDFREVRRGARRDPVGCVGRHDDFLVCRGCRVGYQDYCDDAVYEAQSVRAHGGAGVGLWRYDGADLV